MSLPALNHTQVSNAFIDKFMPIVSPEETKIFLAISRATIGWHKETDHISLTQMQEKTGLSRNSCIRYSKKLEERGLITRSAGTKGTAYTIDYDSLSGSSHGPVEDTGGSPHEPVPASSGSSDALLPPQSGSPREHTKESLKEKEKRKSASPLIEKVFRQAGSDYYHDAREARAGKELSERYFADPGDFTLMVMALQRMRATDKFYRGFPLCPSTLNTFWNKIKEFRANAIASPQPSPKVEETRMANGMTTREYNEQVEREMAERGGRSE